jgi:hypothetical protein
LPITGGDEIMTRVDVIDVVAKEACISKVAAKKAMDAFVRSLVDNIRLAGDVDKYPAPTRVPGVLSVDLAEGKDEGEKEVIQFVNWLAAELDEIHQDLNEILTESNKYWVEIEEIKEDIKKYEPH